MKKILCFGDSNTWGHNPVDCSKLENCWYTVADEMLTDCEMINDGVCGRSTKFDVPDTAQSNGIAVFREKYIEKIADFDLIVIMLGTNDQLNYFDCRAEETAEALREFVRECHNKYGKEKPALLLVSPIHIRREVLDHEIFGQLYSEKSVRESERFAETISRVASEEGVYFLDAAMYASASSLDGVHMDSGEHKKLAIAITAKIRSILF